MLLAKWERRDAGAKRQLAKWRETGRRGHLRVYRQHVKARKKLRGLIRKFKRGGANARVSERGLAFIEHFEGYFSAPYLDPVGVPTVCFGATGEQIAWAAPFPASRAKCREVLRRSLNVRYEPPVRALFRKGGPLYGRFRQFRFDALVSFTYNLGPYCIGPVCPSIWAAIHSGSLRRIADALLAYDKGGGRVWPGLTRRRNAERSLFLDGVYLK